jgi:hypothetical protein
MKTLIHFKFSAWRITQTNWRRCVLKWSLHHDVRCKHLLNHTDEDLLFPYQSTDIHVNALHQFGQFPLLRTVTFRRGGGFVKRNSQCWSWGYVFKLQKNELNNAKLILIAWNKTCKQPKHKSFFNVKRYKKNNRNMLLKTMGKRSFVTSYFLLV